mmetsp:Transcript_37882/g.89110  ORF Transcript_37882/g.89110 Transcript_37882/m.89110 type:complete len:215 (+) Transcript_37882:546-1190(+)
MVLMPCITPSVPRVSVAECCPRPLSRPCPAGSTPTSLTAGSSRKAVKSPSELQPPPTQASSTSGAAPPVISANCCLASKPTMLWKSRTIMGKGWGPTAEPMAKNIASGSPMKAPKAESTASLSDLPPSVTGTTVAPSTCMRRTFGHSFLMSTSPMWISHSSCMSAAAAASATPCCPAPVSAMTLRFPMLFARSASPRQWLILWEPVWLRSSRLR